MIGKFASAAAAAAVLLAAPPAAWAAPARTAAAIADKSRPAEDVARDPLRKPDQMMAFAGVRPGMKVLELLPGGGYFTRIFARAVEPGGRVYAVIKPPAPDAAKPPPILQVAADKAYGDITVLEQEFQSLAPPEPVDLVWTSQNYHDLHLKRLALDVGQVNKAVYAALKPGGVYIVLDHAAAAGAGLSVVDTLHRIEPAVVRREVEAAGFKFEGENRALRNPADDHTKAVFDPALRGHTDQFIYKFRKPR